MKMNFKAIMSLLSLCTGLAVLSESVVQGGAKKTKLGQKKVKVKPVIIKGALASTDPLDWGRRTSYHKVHNVKLRAGIHYSFIMKSSFPPYLRIEDFQGNQQAYTRQVHPTETSVDYTPKENETFRIVATSYSSRKTGQYTVTVKQYAPPPPPKMIPLVMGKNGSLTRASPATRK